MAKVRSDWSIYEDLKAAIEREIDSKTWGLYDGDDEPGEYVVAVSEDYEQVEVLVDPTDEDKKAFLEKHSEQNGWYSVVSDDYFYIIEDWAQFGFDLR